MSSAFSKITTWLEKIRPKKHWGFLVGTLVAFLALVGPWILLDPLFTALFPLLQVSVNIKIALATAIVGIFALLIVGLALLIYNKKFKDIGWNRPKFEYLTKAVAFFVLYFVVSLAVQIVAARFFGLDTQQAQDLGYQTLNPLEKLIAFIPLVLITPIMEETIFRGFMFTGFRAQMSFWPAAITSSAVFGLVHGQWNVGLDVFVMGIVSCYLFEKTKSIWPSVLLHTIKNGVAFYLLYLYNGG